MKAPVSENMVGKSGSTVFPSVKAIRQRFEQAGTVKRVLQAVTGDEKKVKVTGLSGSAVAFLTVALFEHHKKPLCFLTSDPDSAEKAAADLAALLPGEAVHLFPERGVVPYEFRAPHEEVVGRRLQTLFALLRHEHSLVVASLPAVLEQTIPPEKLKAQSLFLRPDDQIDLDEVARRLLALGFSRVPLVEEVGGFAIRGGIVDVFPCTAEDPLRLEFFGDRLDSIRFFSVLDQRSITRTDSTLILPQKEFYLPPAQLEEHLEKLDPRLEAEIREKFAYEPDQPGIEWLAPLFGLERAPLFDYFPENFLLVVDEGETIKSKLGEIFEQAEKLSTELKRRLPLQLSPQSLYGAPEQVWMNIESYAGVEKLPTGQEVEGVIDLETKDQPAFGGKIEFVRAKVRELGQYQYQTFITCETPGQAERLTELLVPMEEEIFLCTPSLAEGFLFPEAQLAVFTDHQIFRRPQHRWPKRRFREGVALSAYTNLQPGDYVVHIDYGIGRFLGIETLIVEGRKRDCLAILYQEGDKLYVPTEEFNRVQKFIGHEGEPTLSRLRSDTWEKLKARTKEALLEMAGELIALSAERKAKPGAAFSPDTPWQKELEAAFIYADTPDQLAAIEAIKSDLEKPAPMDRLVCGDVGFGKTEVAIRAAFKAVQDGKQVAVLVPTTILAQQHYLTFSERLLPYPVTLATLSRFKSRKEQKEVIENLKAGKLDIVIGTHRLLQRDIHFHDLGLLVIDEEQRFGVKQKERIKDLKRQVDVLTLTATPIPRTMQLALYGARDLSVINTAPQGRLPIHTEIIERRDDLVADAILRELARGGQVFFVHNRVQSIESIGRWLGRIVPQARLIIAHGQMPEHRLEKVMLAFLNRKYDLLLATSIIENGLDIPSVNTIIIDRADTFGLAQLYQLRGRVGRSHYKAYAYLLTPAAREMTETARKRLKALAQHGDLGAGFHLALRDLEIRGAGNLLGPQQHGYIEAVGFELYCQLLEEAVRELKGEKAAPEIKVKIEAESDFFLPEAYVTLPAQRVEIYQKIAGVKTEKGVADLTAELADRFGPLPDSVQALLELSRLKLVAQAKSIQKIRLTPGWVEFAFAPEVTVTKQTVERLRRTIPFPLEFSSAGRFGFRVGVPDGPGPARLAQVKSLLLAL